MSERIQPAAKRHRGMPPGPYEAAVLAQIEAAGASVHPNVLGHLAMPGIPAHELQKKRFRQPYEDIEKAIDNAGYILRKQPGTELTDRALRIPTKTPSLSRFMLTILNDSHTPYVETDVPAFSSQASRDLDACKDAEPQFTDMLDADQDYLKSYPLHVVVDDDNQPLLIQKTYGLELLTLSTRELAVNGVRFPEGSLYRTDLAKAAEQGSFHNQNDRTIHVYGQDAVEDIAFLRTTPWSLSSMSERRDYLSRNMPYRLIEDPVMAHNLGKLSLAEFTDQLVGPIPAELS